MATPNNLFQELLTERDVARITGLSVASIRRFRHLGDGPKFLKISASVRYRPEDLKAFLESRSMGGGSAEAR
jgi:predicted DNA-binding transcriptional regulator AlpA